MPRNDLISLRSDVGKLNPEHSHGFCGWWNFVDHCCRNTMMHNTTKPQRSGHPYKQWFYRYSATCRTYCLSCWFSEMRHFFRSKHLFAFLTFFWACTGNIKNIYRRPIQRVSNLFFYVGILLTIRNTQLVKIVTKFCAEEDFSEEMLSIPHIVLKAYKEIWRNSIFAFDFKSNC